MVLFTQSSSLHLNRHSSLAILSRSSHVSQAIFKIPPGDPQTKSTAGPATAAGSCQPPRCSLASERTVPGRPQGEPPPDPEGGQAPGPGDPPPRKPRRGGLHPALLSSSWAWRALPSFLVLSGKGSPLGLLAVPFPRTDDGPLPTVVPNPPGGFLVGGQGPIRLLSDSPPRPLASVPPPFPPTCHAWGRGPGLGGALGMAAGLNLGPGPFSLATVPSHPGPASGGWDRGFRGPYLANIKNFPGLHPPSPTQPSYRCQKV